MMCLISRAAPPVGMTGVCLGVRPGTTYNGIVSGADVFPTFCRLAGATVPAITGASNRRAFSVNIIVYICCALLVGYMSNRRAFPVNLIACVPYACCNIHVYFGWLITGPNAMDGMDVWDALRTKGPSPRHEILYAPVIPGPDSLNPEDCARWGQVCVAMGRRVI